MKKVFIGLIVLMFMLAACAPGSTEQPSFLNDDPSYPNPSYPGPSYPNDSSPVTWTPVEEAVIKQLAGNLGLKIGDISVVSNESIEFSDSCMDVSMPEVMCAQVITPGHIIVIEADGVQYEYHTDEDGTRITPATVALTWKREGGIAGFCDNLSVFLSGEVYGSQCRTGDSRMATFVYLFSATEQKQFASWAAKYEEVNIDASDPKGVSDRMVVTLTFIGQGDQQVIPVTDQQEMLEFAQALYQDLYK
jgi:hypothetical protein